MLKKSNKFNKTSFRSLLILSFFTLTVINVIVGGEPIKNPLLKKRSTRQLIRRNSSVSDKTQSHKKVDVKALLSESDQLLEVYKKICENDSGQDEGDTLPDENFDEIIGNSPESEKDIQYIVTEDDLNELISKKTIAEEKVINLEKELKIIKKNESNKIIQEKETFSTQISALQKQIATEKFRNRLSFALNIFLLCGAGYLAFEYWRLVKLLLKISTLSDYTPIL